MNKSLVLWKEIKVEKKREKGWLACKGRIIKCEGWKGWIYLKAS